MEVLVELGSQNLDGTKQVESPGGTRQVSSPSGLGSLSPGKSEIRRLDLGK